jgi:hypothetical protein
MAEESGASAGDLWDTARVGAESIQGATVEDYSDDESEGIKVSVYVSCDNIHVVIIRFAMGVFKRGMNPEASNAGA